MFYDVLEINAVISKYMLCEVETRDVRVWSYLTVVVNCRNMIKKLLGRQLFQQPRRMRSDLQAEPEKG